MQSLEPGQRFVRSFPDHPDLPDYEFMLVQPEFEEYGMGDVWILVHVSGGRTEKVARSESEMRAFIESDVRMEPELQ